MLKNVLRTRKTVKRARSRTSTVFQLGITILRSFLILEKKTASTFPFPPF